ncbi:hypothetical protein [Deinococcus sonorensis]|uniref:Uncharacterized protein n=2 Tax=Deinococcus sonorensis TaxID=309891 RepID=A0AAU7U877_9DEIO
MSVTLPAGPSWSTSELRSIVLEVSGPFEGQRRLNRLPVRSAPGSAVALRWSDAGSVCLSCTDT